MLTFWLVTLFLSNISAYTADYLTQIPPVNFTLGNAVETDLSYYLYTISQTTPIILDVNTTKVADINRELPTKLFIHGFTTNPELSPWYPLLKHEYFVKRPFNIIYVDWSKAGNLSYYVSAANVRPAGEYMADFLIATKIPPENLHLIGHSLGSHLTGFAGKSYQRKTGKKIGRITALDPAAPSWEFLEADSRLAYTDAEFVDVIHSDIGHFGFRKPLGHVDFYPNGGGNQTGCYPDSDENCNHAKATHFFIDSVNKKKWKAIKTQFGHFNVTDPKEAIFGDDVAHSTRGVYYLVIDDCNSYPYLRSNNEIK